MPPPNPLALASAVPGAYSRDMERGHKVSSYFSFSLFLPRGYNVCVMCAAVEARREGGKGTEQEMKMNEAKE